MKQGPIRPADKGFYFKLNTIGDLKLLRFTLEDNGLVESQDSRRQQWSICWTTTVVKHSNFKLLLKF
jgi:hypothetical protein